MNRVRHLMAYLPWPILILVCATLGLAPFVPEPHIWEKLKMLVSGQLTQPVDIFDFLLHGTPWALLFLKLALRGKTPTK